MKKFKVTTILVPTDFSESSSLALEHAIQMAMLHNANITLLHVIEAFNFTVAIRYFGKEPNYVKQAEKSVLNELTKVAKKAAKENKVEITPLLTIGRVYRQIIKVANDVEADMIIMGSHGVTGFSDYIIGSNTNRVVSGTQCPVLSVQSHAKEYGYKKILLPIDNTVHSRKKVPLVVDIARKYNAEILVVALNTTDDKFVRNQISIITNQVGDFIKKKKVNFTMESLVGENTAVMLLGYAKKKKADLITIMSEHELDHTGLLMGPFAEHVVNHSQIPVLSIKEEVKYMTFEPNPY